MIPLIVGIFLFIFFIVTIVLSVSSWRGWHIAAACLTFLAGIGLVICASLSVKTHTHWRREYANAERELEAVKLEMYTRQFGDPTMVESEVPPVNDIQARLNRILLDRGRVWRQCTPGAPTGTGILVSTVPPRPDGAAGEAGTAPPNGIPANMVLYAFRENDRKLPVAYLGEFKVVDAQPTNVTLERTMPLDGLQERLIADQSARWSLYEMMPIDSHHVFADEDTISRPLDDQNKPIFGRMDEQQLRTMFSEVVGVALGRAPQDPPPPDDPLVSELVGPYLVDGLTSSEAGAKVPVQAENEWWKLEFEKPHQERVDSNNLDPGLSGNYFDPEGYAEVTRLRVGGEGARSGMASIRVNDIGVFPYCQDIDKQLVDGLISRGICRNLGPFYVRSLRDYEESFHDVQAKFIKRNEDIRRAQRDVAALNVAVRKTQEQIAYRQEERSKLTTDSDKFTVERQKVSDLAATLEAQKSALQQELSQLFKTNLALTQQLAAIDSKLTEEINRRTASVVAQ